MIKICGIRSAKIIKILLDYNVDYIGFVHYTQSPRHLEIQDIQVFLNQFSNLCEKAVIVTVNPSNECLKNLISIGVKNIQLHGQETLNQIQLITDKYPYISIIKALNFDKNTGLDKIQDRICKYEKHVYKILLDTKVFVNDISNLDNSSNFLEKSSLLNWEKLSYIPNISNHFIAGGIDITNLFIVKKYFQHIDLSSTLETRPGIKDIDKVSNFLKAWYE